MSNVYAWWTWFSCRSSILSFASFTLLSRMIPPLYSFVSFSSYFFFVISLRPCPSVSVTCHKSDVLATPGSRECWWRQAVKLKSGCCLGGPDQREITTCVHHCVNACVCVCNRVCPGRHRKRHATGEQETTGLFVRSPWSISKSPPFYKTT